MSKSLKKSIIQTFLSAPQMDGLERNDVILTTSIGLIYGKPLVEENMTDAETTYKVLLDITKEDFVGAKISENDGDFVLTEATIKPPAGGKINLGHIVVFYDQIIGVSLGTLSE